jgi:hypothetical protein
MGSCVLWSDWNALCNSYAIGMKPAKMSGDLSGAEVEAIHRSAVKLVPARCPVGVQMEKHLVR